MVVGFTEITVLVVAIIAAIVLYKVLKTFTKLAINAVIGIFILIVAQAFLGIQIASMWIAVIICAIGGIFGAFLVILLSYLKIGFV